MRNELIEEWTGNTENIQASSEDDITINNNENDNAYNVNVTNSELVISH